MLVFAALPLVAGRGLVARARAAPWRASVAAALLLLLLAGAWSPRLPPVLHMQAWVTAGDLLDRWRPTAAETAYERAVAAFPASDRPLVILGDARRRAGDTAGAIDAYAAALAIQPHNLAAALPLMDLERLTGQPDDARRVLRATDTSDATLLAWAWRRHAPPPTAAVDVGSGFEFGSLINFYAPEGQAPTDFRWTNGHGLVRLTVPPGGAARLTMRLSGMRPRGAPPAGRVDILVDGRALGAVAADGGWRTDALDLARARPGARLDRPGGGPQRGRRPGRAPARRRGGVARRRRRRPHRPRRLSDRAGGPCRLDRRPRVCVRAGAGHPRDLLGAAARRSGNAATARPRPGHGVRRPAARRRRPGPPRRPCYTGRRPIGAPPFARAPP